MTNWGIGSRARALKELGELFVENGRWWLVPLLGVLIASALLLFGLQAAQYVAPFVYSVF